MTEGVPRGVQMERAFEEEIGWNNSFGDRPWNTQSLALRRSIIWVHPSRVQEVHQVGASLPPAPRRTIKWVQPPRWGLSTRLTGFNGNTLWKPRLGSRGRCPIRKGELSTDEEEPPPIKFLRFWRGGEESLGRRSGRTLF